MSRKIRNWLQNIQEGRSKEIARAFFKTFETKTNVTRQFYPKNYNRRREKYKRGYVEPIISRQLKQWEEEGFVEISNQKVQYIKQEKGKKDKLVGKPSYAYLMTLEPLYKFCKNKGIEFNKKEKDFLNLHFKLGEIRKNILEEYPNEDIINANLKYYVKHYIIPYGYFLRLKLDFPEKFEKYENRAKKINSEKYNWDFTPTKESLRKSEEFFRKEGFNEKQIKEMIKSYTKMMKEFEEERQKKKYDFLDILSYESEFIGEGFSQYVNRAKRDKELIYSVDQKIMEALGIYPG